MVHQVRLRRRPNIGSITRGAHCCRSGSFQAVFAQFPQRPAHQRFLLLSAPKKIMRRRPARRYVHSVYVGVRNFTTGLLIPSRPFARSGNFDIRQPFALQILTKLP